MNWNSQKRMFLYLTKSGVQLKQQLVLPGPFSILQGYCSNLQSADLPVPGHCGQHRCKITAKGLSQSFLFYRVLANFHSQVPGSIGVISSFGFWKASLPKLNQTSDLFCVKITGLPNQIKLRWSLLCNTGRRQLSMLVTDEAPNRYLQQPDCHASIKSNLIICNVLIGIIVSAELRNVTDMAYISV